MSDYREPGRATAAGRRSVIARQNAPDDILVELDAEGIRDLLGDLAAAEVWVAPEATACFIGPMRYLAAEKRAKTSSLRSAGTGASIDLDSK
ncbi:hypothetical protein [Candidatus Binatus sp.]|uniref:hypothetical protein n=1 Tax=Candidatus Binatus sp. TaxID=2811406 RepID=UPI003BE4A376